MATTNFNIGDVEKQMDDLSAFSGKAIANNLTTSTEGYVLDARQGKELNDHIATLLTRVGNIKSLTLVSDTATTGSTGNIATGLSNTGKILLFGGYASGTNAVVLPFVSSVNNGWYLKVRDADTMATINNTSVAIRYYVLEMV